MAVHTLVSFPTGSPKLAILLTWENKTLGVGSFKLVPLLYGLVKAELGRSLLSEMGCEGVLCSVGQYGQLFF